MQIDLNRPPARHGSQFGVLRDGWPIVVVMCVVECVWHVWTVRAVKGPVHAMPLRFLRLI